MLWKKEGRKSRIRGRQSAINTKKDKRLIIKIQGVTRSHHRSNTKAIPTTGIRGVIFTDSLSTMIAASEEPHEIFEDQKD
jgi:hypothetical protein